MPRRREVAERSIRPDSKFGSKLVAKFINCLMHDGKRSTSEGIVYEAFQIITEKTKESPVKLFEQALENVRPMIEVRSRRVGGFHLPGAHRDPPLAAHGAGVPLAHQLRAPAAGKGHGQETGRRVPGRLQQPRVGGEEAGRYA